MDFKEQFDMPLPIINKEENKIYIETANSCNGSLMIKNDGGGVITGRIMSNSGSITFDPEYFSGNDIKITFYVNLDFYNPGDTIRTNAVVMSNGGEHLIDFIIKVVPYAIETKEDFRVASLKDFYSYARKYPVSARQLFVSHEFMMWLYSSGYEYMDLYERFIKDANKERALDNFFVLNKFKQKTTISCADKFVTIKVSPYTNDVQTGSIAILKNGWGYVEEKIFMDNEHPWLKIDKSKLGTTDFDDSESAYINYFINPKLLNKNINIEKIIVGEQEITITVIKINYIEARLECEFLPFSGNSNIIIKNNSGSRLTVDIRPKVSFIKIEAVRFFVNEYAKIPFTIEFSTLQSAQMSIMKQPVIETEILIESIFDMKSFEKILPLSIGEF